MRDALEILCEHLAEAEHPARCLPLHVLPAFLHVAINLA